MTQPHEKQDAARPNAEPEPAGADADSPLRDESNGDAADGRPKEVGGRPGPDPTRYGDWEKNGRCIDF